MSQTDSWLRCCLYILSVFTSIVGVLLLLLTLLFQIITKDEDMEGVSLLPLYLVGVATVVIAALGGVGAHKENKVCLIVFLVCVVMGALFMLMFGAAVAMARPHQEGELIKEFKSNLPLDTATDDVKSMTESLQKDFYCCGLFSYKDWDNIPDTCLCIDKDVECQTVQVDFTDRSRTKTIYKPTCFPILLHYVLIVTDVIAAVFFSVFVLALLGVILASIMIHQMNRALISSSAADAADAAQQVSYGSSGVSWS